MSINPERNCPVQLILLLQFICYARQVITSLTLIIRDSLRPRRVSLQQNPLLPVIYNPFWCPFRSVCVRVKGTDETCPIALHDGHYVGVQRGVVACWEVPIDAIWTPYG